MTEPPATPAGLRYSGLAVVSLVLGVLSLAWYAFGLAWGIFGFIAVMAGQRARKEMILGSLQLEGRGLAMGGIVAGATGFVTSLFLLVMIVTAGS